MTDLDLDAIQARADAATPGPWEDDFPEISNVYPGDIVVDTELECGSYCYGGTARLVVSDADQDFIIHARQDIPALVAEVRRLRQMLGKYSDMPIQLGEPYLIEESSDDDGRFYFDDGFQILYFDNVVDAAVAVGIADILGNPAASVTRQNLTGGSV